MYINRKSNQNKSATWPQTTQSGHNLQSQKAKLSNPKKPSSKQPQQPKTFIINNYKHKSKPSNPATKSPLPAQLATKKQSNKQQVVTARE